VIYGYLDREIGSKPYLVADRYTIADITVASFFVNMKDADAAPDPQRYPNLARYLQEHHARPILAGLVAQELESLAARF
jgi:glutathione S-transferase